ncbi:hypothetical protein J21TS3_07090 [Paenibacillus cookii]|uniref:Uncharacterized protein n=1 Tax=Paenibacillus cookii TaxID=157839 RepID=A0ABQ4LS26_9BACL|nr:hypothetical protein J21TS3_07090 [Paenibacillus cookii]
MHAKNIAYGRDLAADSYRRKNSRCQKTIYKPTVGFYNKHTSKIRDAKNDYHSRRERR